MVDDGEGPQGMKVVESSAPCLRFLEAVPDPANERVFLRDPSQLAAGVLVVGHAELFLLSLLDGTRANGAIRDEYARATGQILPASQLEALLDQLESDGFLAGPRFDA